MFCRCSRGRCGLYGGCLGQRVDVTCPAPLLAALAFMALTACALVLATSEVGMLGYRLSFQRVHAAGGARAAQHFAARPPAQHGGARASTAPAVDGDERRTEAPRKQVYETARPRTSATAGEAMDCEPSAAQSGATTTRIPHLIHQVRVARVRCPSRGGRAVSTVPCWRKVHKCAILARVQAQCACHGARRSSHDGPGGCDALGAAARCPCRPGSRATASCRGGWSAASTPG